MKLDSFSIPSLTEAEIFLNEAEARNPGVWVPHSRMVATAAQHIAAQIPEMDATVAMILGLLHDIGRGAGVSDMRHIIDGYRFMQARGYFTAARISLTHSFQIQDVQSMKYNWDGTPEDMDFIGSFLNGITYNDYDRLIQLCDALALPDGCCLIEKRMVDVVMRRGIHEYVIPKWKAIFGLQQYFEQRIGRSIYTLLPRVIETTFGVQQASFSQ